MARRIKLFIHTGYVGGDYIDYLDLPNDWDKMSEKHQNEFLDEVAQDHLNNHIDYGAAVEEDE